MLVLALALAAIQAPPAPSQQPPPACSAPEHRQFDFWVGEWSVTKTGQTKPVGSSLVEKIYAGCAIRENWMPLSGSTGGSLNNFYEGKWRQIWIDSSNSRVEFTGGLVDGRMVLTGFWKGVNGPGQDALIRMTYSKNPDGSVRQHGEQSTDDGNSWSTNFDFTYHPKTRSAP